jgi:hypothetical protein
VRFQLATITSSVKLSLVALYTAVGGEVIELLTGRNSEKSLISLSFSFGQFEGPKHGIIEWLHEMGHICR